jgi:hypothetical protein
MSADRRVLRSVAIVLNLLAAAWWIWTSVRVTSRVGPAALLSSGALLWIAFTIPPIIAVVALALIGRRNSN